MKYLLLTITALLAFIPQHANADSIRNLKVTKLTISFLPNDGSGDNAFFSLNARETSIQGVAGTGCFAWCGLFNTFAPGSVLRPSISFFGIDGFFSVKMDTRTLNPDSFGIGSSSILALKGFRFPAGAVVPSFTVHIPATIPGPWSGIAQFGAQFIRFHLDLPAKGQLALTFTSTIGPNGLPAYEFTSGKYIAMVSPEPGTLALAAIGLAGIGTLRKKRRSKRSAAL
jgi:PEP-CTERM motif